MAMRRLAFGTTSLPTVTPSNTLDVLRLVKQTLDAWSGQGDPNARVITYGDLGDLALGGGTTTIVVGGGGGSGSGSSYDPTTDLTTPPAPIGVAAAGGYSTIVVRWDAPSVAYRNASYAEIWRSDVNNLGSATLVGVSTTNFYVDSPGLGVTRYYWVRFVSQAAVIGPYNAGATAGVPASTAIDVEQTLAALSGKIRFGQLYTDLATPIQTIVLGQDAAAEAALAGALSVHAETISRARDLLAETRDRGTAIADVRRVVAEGDAQLASQLAILTATVNTNAASVTSLSEAMAAADGAASLRLDALESTVNNPSTGVAATASALSALSTAVGAIDGEVAAQASAISTLQSSVNSPTISNNPTYAALQTEASTRATETGNLLGKYSVKIDLAGFISGYGLLSEANNGATVSEFAVRADRFYVAPSVNYSQESAPVGATLNQRWFRPSTKEVKRWNGSSWAPFNTLPLVVQTVPTTEGGQPIEAGVYIDAAYIINLTATYARIASLVADQITAADINVAQLTGGIMRVGGFVESQSFASGSAGFRFNAAGDAELNNAVVRGTIYASAGVFSGSLSGATGTFAGSLSAATGTFSGSLAAAGGTFAGSLVAATGTFSGSLSAATGTFAGALTAATGTLGALTIDSGGHIKLLASAYNTDGLFFGDVGGVAKFSLKNGTKSLLWDGTDLYLNNFSLDSFTASISGGNISVSVAAGDQSYGSRTVSVSGGRSPYTYFWVVSQSHLRYTSIGQVICAVYIDSGAATATASFRGRENGATNTADVACFVRDANGRIAMASISISAAHAYDAGAGD